METALKHTPSSKGFISSFVPPLDEILFYYDTKGLLAHKDTVLHMNPLIAQLPTTISPAELLHNVAWLSVWPLLERAKLFTESIERDLNHEESDRLQSLTKKYQQLEDSEEFIETLHRGLKRDSLQVNYLHPYTLAKEHFVTPLLSVMCPPLRKHIQATHLSRTKIFHDAQMGGSFYTLGEDKAVQKVPGASYSFYQRSFLCKDKWGENILFMDNIESGEPYFRTVDHWRGYDESQRYHSDKNKIHHLHLSFASTMSIATSLGINTIVPRDFELVELARSIGLGEKTIFSLNQGYWKVGLHSRRLHTGVYTHSLYRACGRNGEGHQLRHPTLTLSDRKYPHEVLHLMTKISSDILMSNYGRKKIAPRTREKVNALLSQHALIHHFPLSSRSVQEQADDIVGVTSYALKNLPGVEL